MLSAPQNADQAASSAHPSVKAFATSLGDALVAAMARRQTRHIVRGLSEAQLRDSGIDPASVLGDRPVIVSDVRLETYLASLR
jgi:hypothetical protein